MGKGSKKADDATIVAVEGVREEILRADEAKDRIIAFIEGRSERDESTRSIWIGDVKEAYYNTLAAWEMLRGVAKGEGEGEYPSACRRYLGYARDRLGCALSELEAFDSEKARGLISMFGLACEKACNTMDALLKGMVPPEPLSVPRERLVVKGPRDVEILCQVCGKMAMSFRIGDFLGTQGLVYTGVTHRCLIPEEKVDEVFELLRKDDLAKVHKLVKEGSWAMEDGLDGYCPECDKVYCPDHIHMQVVWDEGFYDCTYGTCPAGHKRVIDD